MLDSSDGSENGNETEGRNRRAGPGRRTGKDRRKMQDPNFRGPEKRINVVDQRIGLERRRGAGKRLTESRKSAAVLGRPIFR